MGGNTNFTGRGAPTDADYLVGSSNEFLEKSFTAAFKNVI